MHKCILSKWFAYPFTHKHVPFWHIFGKMIILVINKNVIRDQQKNKKTMSGSTLQKHVLDVTSSRIYTSGNELVGKLLIDIFITRHIFYVFLCCWRYLSVCELATNLLWKPISIAHLVIFKGFCTPPNVHNISVQYFSCTNWCGQKTRVKVFQSSL